MPGSHDHEALILNHLLELRAEVAANSAQIVELRGDFHELKEDVKALQSAPMANKKLVTARDSALAGAGGVLGLLFYSAGTKLCSLILG